MPPWRAHDDLVNLNRAFWRAPPLQTPAKFDEKTPRERRNSGIWGVTHFSQFFSILPLLSTFFIIFHNFSPFPVSGFRFRLGVPCCRSLPRRLPVSGFRFSVSSLDFAKSSLRVITPTKGLRRRVRPLRWRAWRFPSLVSDLLHFLKHHREVDGA